MSKILKAITILVVASFVVSGSGMGYAVVKDSQVILIGPVVIGELSTMDVNVLNRSDDQVAASVIFPTPGASPWVIADQYLQIVYNSNLPLYAIRIVSDNNNAASPYNGMAPKPLTIGPDNVWGTADDAVSYGGLIDAATMSNPENRANLVWQVFADKVNPTPLTNESLYGRDPDNGLLPDPDLDPWNADWAAVVDKSNKKVGGAPVDIGVDPDSDYTTVTYSSIIQGGAGGSGLNYHPATYVGGSLQAKPGDGNVVTYIGAKLGGLSAGTYNIYGLTVELIYNE